MDDTERIRELEAEHAKFVRHWQQRRYELGEMRVELAAARKRLLLAELASDKEHQRIRAVRKQEIAGLNTMPLETTT